MHILHINLAKGFRGGERQTSLLINGLAKAYPDLMQSLVIRHDSPLPEYIDANSNIHIIKIAKPFSLSLFKAPLRTSRYTLIHAHEAKACHLAYLLSKKTHTPYIMTRRMDRAPKRDWFTKKVYQHASHIVSLSSAIHNIIATTVNNKKMSIIPSMAASLPSSTSTVEQIRQDYSDKIIIGHVGALVTKHKGQHFIIEAARQLQNTHPNIHFLLVGEGKDRPLLEEEAQNLTNVEFIGFKPNIGDYLRAFDLFIFPSLEEGLGSTLLDAMDATLPIIASKAGGIPDIIKHDDNGWLIPPKSSQAIIDSVLTLIGNKSLAQRLANKGKEESMQYHPSVISQRYMSVYSSIC